MADSTINRDSDKFMLRFPEGMRDRIKDAAAKSKRSMNAEIVDRLEGSFHIERIDDLRREIDLAEERGREERMEMAEMRRLLRELTLLLSQERPRDTIVRMRDEARAEGDDLAAESFQRILDRNPPPASMKP